MGSDMEQQIAGPVRKPSWSLSKDILSNEDLVFVALRGLFMIAILPLVIAGLGGCILSPLILMLLFSFHKNLSTFGVAVEDVPDSTSPSSANVMPDIYGRSRHKETVFHRLMMGSFSLLARSGLFLLVWLVLNVTVPRLRRLTLMGSPLWRWSLLAVALTSAYFVAIAVYLLPGILQTLYKKVVITLFSITLSNKSYSHPYIDLSSALFPSGTLAMYSGMVLLSWLLYFRTEDGLRHASTPHTQAFEYVTWTCICLFVGSILLLLKTLVLLKWSDSAIYRRFEPKILITRVKFVYLCLLIGGFFDYQIIRELKLLKEDQPASFNFTNYIMSQKLDIYYLQEACRLLASLAHSVRPLQEDGVPELLKCLQDKKFYQNSQECEPADGAEKELFQKHGPLYIISRLFPQATVCKHYMCRLNGGIAANILLCLVREQDTSTENQLTSDDLKKWVVDAHMNCVNMGRTLADASAIVTRLDIFISFIILVIVLLLWLLITGIATTTVLVTIVTPLLALAFIFGDSTKQFFQGIIFCFGTHAFDVGDRCILDDTELEVKRMGILTTTFIKIGTAEKRMYPNSVLATKAIINLGWQPDPSDMVELTLDYSTTLTDWQMLEKKVELFFKDPQQKEFFQSSHEMMMKESGDKIKVTIRFKHVLNVKEMTHGECLLKKNRQRSKILTQVNHFLGHTLPTTTRNDENGGSVNSQVFPRIDVHQPSITTEIAEFNP